MSTRPQLTHTIFSFLAIAMGPAFAQTPTFQHEVLPLFQKRCLACHSTNAAAGVDLRSLESIMAGSSAGPILKPGSPSESPLWKTLEAGKMPKAGTPLSESELSLLRSWIEKGQFPTQESATELHKGKILDRAKTLWSFQSPRKALLPKVLHQSRVRTPIDAFLLAKLESSKLSFNPDAPREQLIRRLSFDLTGLSPTPEEVQAFIVDRSPKAYENLVDRLLASPHFGERWARYWLDVAGYADSNGYLGDEPRTEAWRYRDWVVNAFNQDLPYDRFITLQLAGDQVAQWRMGEKMSPEAVRDIIPTGFLRLPADGTDNQKIYQLDKVYDAIHASTEVPLKALMGLSFNCAKCHDHKFDPILQEDYYRLSALLRPVFDPSNWYAANIGSGTTPTRFIPNAPREQVEAYQKLERELQTQGRQRRLKQVELLRKARVSWREAKFAALEEPLRTRLLDISKMPESQRDAQAKELMKAQEARFPVSDEQLSAQDPELKKLMDEDTANQDRLKALRPDLVWGVWDVSKNPETRVLIRGNYEAPGDLVEPGVPAALNRAPHMFQLPVPAPDAPNTGRRLALARWLTQPGHPLTARVIVNRIWQMHFGRGLVSTPDDFGTQGAKPTHPELLDWLAVGLVENGWSLKWLHRQILLSTAFRQASTDNVVARKADESNKLLWRWAPRRLEAEAIRDTMLQVSGQLVDRLGGEPIPICRGEDGQSLPDPSGRIDDKLRGTSFKPPPCGKLSSNLDASRSPNRRSLYLQYRRQYVVDFLVAFDAPMMDTNAPNRFRSALPQQSLAALHNPFVVETARHFASRVKKEAGLDPALQATRALSLAYSRKPRESEILQAKTILARYGESPRGLELLCQALLASSEFLHID